MCSGKKISEPASPVKYAGMAGSGVLPDARSPHLYQLSKPKLSRSIAPGVKINLNKYWSKFGEMMSPVTRPAASLGRKLSRETSAKREEDAMEAGEGIIVQPRFQVFGGLSEADENVINELREICWASTMVDQYLNCKCY